MPSTRKSADGTEGRKRRSSPRNSIDDSSPPKAKKEKRRGSRSSLRMQNKMSGVTLPDIKDDTSSPRRKERTPRKSSKEETDHVEEEMKAQGGSEDPVVIEESMGDKDFQKDSDEAEEDAVEVTEEENTPCVDGGEEEVAKELCEKVESDKSEDTSANNNDGQDTVKEPSPVINGGSGEPVHVQALA